MDFVYPITSVEQVTDGDTYWFRLDADIGFRMHMQPLICVRLYGWDCPELHKPKSDFEKAQAVIAQQTAAAWLATPGQFFVQTYPASAKPFEGEIDPDDFGRWLGDVYCVNTDGSQSHLGVMLAARGLASPWPTRWRYLYDPAFNGSTTP